MSKIDNFFFEIFDICWKFRYNFWHFQLIFDVFGHFIYPQMTKMVKNPKNYTGNFDCWLSTFDRLSKIYQNICVSVINFPGTFSWKNSKFRKPYQYATNGMFLTGIQFLGIVIFFSWNWIWLFLLFGPGNPGMMLLFLVSFVRAYIWSRRRGAMNYFFQTKIFNHWTNWDEYTFLFMLLLMLLLRRCCCCFGIFIDVYVLLFCVVAVVIVVVVVVVLL